MDDGNWVSLTDAAKQLRMARPTLLRLIAAGRVEHRIRTLAHRRRVWIHADEIEKLQPVSNVSNEPQR